MAASNNSFFNAKWPDGAVADLDRLWRENVLSARAIGEYLTTKYHRTFSVNSVVGQAHRSGLPGKASPTKSTVATWTDEVCERLKELWLPGQQTSRQIADTLNTEFGISVKWKGVCERAKAMGLPNRSGHMMQKGRPRGNIVPRKQSALSYKPGENTKAGAQNHQTRYAVFDKAKREERRAATPLDGGTVPASRRNGVGDQNAIDKATPSHFVPFKAVLPRHPCRWIEGEPRGVRTVYCDAPSEPGKDWCPVHYAVCYQPARKAQAGQTLGPAP